MKQTADPSPETKCPTVGHLEVLPPETKCPTVGHLTLSPASIDQRLEKFVDHHNTVMLSAGNILVSRFLAGVELLAIKSALSESRGFEAYCKAKIIEKGVTSRGSIHNYMNYAEAIVEKFPKVGNLVQQRLLPGGALPDDAKADLQEAIYEAADGKDVTAFYRALGVIREKKDAAHHPRKPVDVEATEAERDKAANEDWCAIIADVELHLGVLERITPENQDRALQTLLKATALLRTLGKGKAKKKNSSAARTQPKLQKEIVSPTGAEGEHQVKRGPAQSTWIAFRNAEGLIDVAQALKLPAHDDRISGFEYSGPFNAKGRDHAMEQARILFAPLKRLMTPAQKKQWKSERSEDPAQVAATGAVGKSSARKPRVSPEERAKLAAAARNRWAKAEQRGASK